MNRWDGEREEEEQPPAEEGEVGGARRPGPTRYETPDGGAGGKRFEPPKQKSKVKEVARPRRGRNQSVEKE